MKKMKRKVSSRREFVRMISLAAPAIFVAATASAYDPMEYTSTDGGTTRKKAPRKKAPARKKAVRKKAIRRPGDPVSPRYPE